MGLVSFRYGAGLGRAHEQERCSAPFLPLTAIARGVATLDKTGMSQNADRRTAVIIAAFNAEATLDKAVQSALDQAETAEVCIVDDGSADATAAIAKAWVERDPRVRFRALPSNYGPAAARNVGIEVTSAPWIAILDADDFLAPGRFAALHEHAGEADFVADALIRTSDGQFSAAPAVSFEVEPLSFERFVLGNLGRVNGPLDLGFLKPVMSRSFLNAHGLRYREDLRLGEDYELYAHALALGARFLVGGPAGYVSLERPGSLSKDHSIADLQRLRDCDLPLSKLRTYSHAERRALQRHWNSVDCRLQWRRLIEAVKTRNAAAAVSTFRSPETAAFLAARLAEQVWLRGNAALRRAVGMQDSAGAGA
jgi:succinoglycan biosynthesis protein ExoU